MLILDYQDQTTQRKPTDIERTYRKFRNDDTHPIELT